MKQKISIQISAIIICMILLIPTVYGETVLNFILPTINFRTKSGSGVFFVSNLYSVILLLVAVVSFLRLRDNLKKMNSNWRYLLYFIVIMWLTTNIRTIIGEKIMTFRKGLEAVELKFDKSEIRYEKDSLGIIHAEGKITFRNYSSDTVAFKGILYNENFGLMNEDKITDISFPIVTSSEKEQFIKIPPKTTYSYPVKFDSKLKVCNSTKSKYSGTINRITRFTIYSDNDKKTFED